MKARQFLKHSVEGPFKYFPSFFILQSPLWECPQENKTKQKLNRNSEKKKWFQSLTEAWWGCWRDGGRKENKSGIKKVATLISQWSFPWRLWPPRQTGVIISVTTAMVITFIYGAPKNGSVPDSFKVRFSRWMTRRRTLLSLLVALQRRPSKRYLVVEEYHNGKVLTRNSCKCWWIWGYRKTQLLRYRENCLRFVHVSCQDLLRREESNIFFLDLVFY